LGLERFGTVNILGFNSPEWIIANMAAIMAGAKAAGIYTTSEAEACWYITDHSRARIVVVEDVKQLDKYKKIGGRLPHLAVVVVWKNFSVKDESPAGHPYPFRVMSWSSLLELGLLSLSLLFLSLSLSLCLFIFYLLPSFRSISDEGTCYR
jgi:long-chain-fatty-acid--CoA ligase ACSBG